LLKGLEVSEVRFSGLNDEHRIDAECYRKSFLQFEKAICAKKYTTVGDVARFLIGPFGSAFDTANYIENGKYRYVRGQDVKPFILKDDDCRYVPEADFNRLSKYALKENDVLVSVVGTLGNACIVEKKDLPAIFSCKSTVIRAEKINPIVLLAYLNCRYGRELLLRKEHGAIQKGLNLDDLKTLLIPVFDNDFQQKIASLVKSAHAKLAESKALYAQAEDTLLCELGLKDWQPGNEAVSIKKFSDFASSGRLDAEYYQSKYDELFKKLAHYNCKHLGDIVSVKKSVEPGSDSYKENGIPFIRVSDVNKYGIAETDLHLSAQEFNLKDLRPHKDTILFSKDGSIGIAYKCEKDLDAITSGALLHLSIKDTEVLPDYLTMVLNSIVVQLQAERDSNGAIIQHWKPDDIKRVIIPILPHETQNQIASLIQRSFALRAESSFLLDEAKANVEREIEN